MSTKLTSCLVALVLAAALSPLAVAQVINAEQIVLQGRVPPTVSGIVAQPTGTQGSVTLYYWVTARYPSGVSTPAGPARAVNTQGIAGLSPANAVRISWQAAAGATGYDVIRLTVPQFPSGGTCTNCVVSSNQAGTTFLDTGGAVVNWPTAGTVPARSTTFSMALNNQDHDYPFLSSPGEVHLSPTRSTNSYAYLFSVRDSAAGVMTGGANQKTYAVGILVSRPSTAIASGDSNDALLRGTYNNYAKNDSNFIIRGVNTTVSNRSPGTLGILEGGLISSANRSGSTAPTVRGLSVGVENYGTVSDEFSGVDIDLRNEGAKATLEYGLRVRNTNNSTTSAADSAIQIRNAGTNTGFVYGLDLLGAGIVRADLRLHNAARINNPSITDLHIAGVDGNAFLADFRNEGSTIVRSTQWTDDADGADFAARKARGTPAAPAIVQDGDEIGAWRANGWDGTDFVGGAEISARVSGTPGAGDMPTALVFSVSPDGSTVASERMRLLPGGGVALAPLAFANLGAPQNGTIVYCSDCDPAAAGAGPTVCSTGGASTGALAIRLNGAWTCLGI